MQAAGRIALAAAAATGLVTGTAAAVDAYRTDLPDSAPLSSEASEPAALEQRLTRLVARTGAAQLELAQARRALLDARVTLTDAQLAAARQALAQQAAAQRAITDPSQAAPSSAPEPHTSTGASSADHREDAEEDDREDREDDREADDD